MDKFFLLAETQPEREAQVVKLQVHFCFEFGIYFEWLEPTHLGSLINYVCHASLSTPVMPELHAAANRTFCRQGEQKPP